MATIDWPAIFDDFNAAPGASEADLQHLAETLFQPVSDDEAAAINTEQFDIDPAGWVFPEFKLPESFLSLLKWSNGGNGITGEREFGFFPATDSDQGLRAMMLAYHVPQYMPFALPFAFNGGGTFYLFDMRKPAVDGEYPVVCCEAGALGFDDESTGPIANSLVEACTGREDVDSLRFPEQTSTFVDLTLTGTLSLKQLATLNKLFQLCDSIGQLRTKFAAPPVPLAEMELSRARKLLSDHPDLVDAVEARDSDDPTIVHSLSGA